MKRSKTTPLPCRKRSGPSWGGSSVAVIELRNAELIQTVTKEAKLLDITQDVITGYSLPARCTSTPSWP